MPPPSHLAGLFACSCRGCSRLLYERAADLHATWLGTGGSGSTMFHGCSTTHDTPRCSTSVRWTLVEHSWNTRGTLVEHSWNTSDPWGLYSSVGSAHKHSWNTRGTRHRYGKPGARLAILRLVTSSFSKPITGSSPGRAKKFSKWSWVRIPVWVHFEHFCSGHRFESRSCKTLEFL